VEAAVIHAETTQEGMQVGGGLALRHGLDGLRWK
jgi:hypothetical protein